MKASSQGCRPPDQGNRAQYSMSTTFAGQPNDSVPGIAGSSDGLSRNRPKVFAAKAAEDSGLEIFPLSSSLPGAFAKAFKIFSTGRYGRNGPFISQASSVQRVITNASMYLPAPI